jgi:hypothetical protein
MEIEEMIKKTFKKHEKKTPFSTHHPKLLSRHPLLSVRRGGVHASISLETTDKNWNSFQVFQKMCPYLFFSLQKYSYFPQNFFFSSFLSFFCSFKMISFFSFFFLIQSTTILSLKLQKLFYIYTYISLFISKSQRDFIFFLPPGVLFFFGIKKYI